MNAELRIVFVTGVTQILYEPAPKISEKCPEFKSKAVWLHDFVWY